MTSAYAEHHADLLARASAGDMAAWAEMALAARFSRHMGKLPETEAETLAAIDAAEHDNRRNLEMLGLDPSRATELANAQRAALKGEAQP